VSLLVILGAVGGLAVTVGLAILVSLLTSEAKGNIPVACRNLLDRTAARLPAEMQDRREEWESDLKDAADRPITQMVIALRIWRNGRALAQEAIAGVAESEVSANQLTRKSAGLVTALALLGRPIAAGRRIGRGLLMPHPKARDTVGSVLVAVAAAVGFLSANYAVFGSISLVLMGAFLVFVGYLVLKTPK
jgi:hypothetical protein